MEFSVYGLGVRTPVRIRGDVDSLAPAVQAAWSRSLAPIEDDEAGVVSEPVRVRLVSSPADDPDPDEPTEPGTTAELTMTTVADLMPLLTQRITAAKIQAQRGKLFMLHSGALAHPDTGDTVALVAPGGTGKTTLVRTLATAYGYVTDETVAVSADRRVLPYPKPLSFRPLAPGPKQERSPDADGLLVAPAGPRLRRLVLLARDDDHGAVPEIEELSTFEAITALVPETSSLAALPRPLHALADLLGALDPTVRLRYTDAETVADLVGSWLEPR